MNVIGVSICLFSKDKSLNNVITPPASSSAAAGADAVAGQDAG